MANPSPSLIKVESIDTLHSTHQLSLSPTSIYDSFVDNTLPVQRHDGSPVVSLPNDIDIDAPMSPSSHTSDDFLPEFCAPATPVYINMGSNEQTDHMNIAQPITTTDQTVPHLFAPVDLDQPLSASTFQKYNHHHHHHHHHFPHHQQNRNRYPYLRRSIVSKEHHLTQYSSPSLEGLSYYDQRPAFRRSYFALKRQRIPIGI